MLAAHVGTPFVTGGQGLMQPPQCWGSVDTFTHELLQLVRPEPHAVVHTLWLQT
jgi:hypothetical protein